MTFYKDSDSFGDGLRTMETMEKSRLVFVMPPD